MRGGALARERAARGLHEFLLRRARRRRGAEETRRGPHERPVRVPERRLAAGEERVARGRVPLSSRAFLFLFFGVGFVPPENLRRGRRPSVRPGPGRRRRQPRVVFLPGGLRRSLRRGFGVGVSRSFLFRDRGASLRLGRERRLARTLRRGFTGEVAAVEFAAASDRRERGLVPDRDADRQRVALVERRRDARATQRAEQRAGRVVRVFPSVAFFSRRKRPVREEA